MSCDRKLTGGCLINGKCNRRRCAAPATKLLINPLVISGWASEHLRRRRWRAEMLPVGKRRTHQLSAARSIFQRMKFDRDPVTRFDGIRAPACRSILLYRLHFE